MNSTLVCDCPPRNNAYSRKSSNKSKYDKPDRAKIQCTLHALYTIARLNDAAEVINIVGIPCLISPRQASLAL